MNPATGAVAPAVTSTRPATIISAPGAVITHPGAAFDVLMVTSGAPEAIASRLMTINSPLEVTSTPAGQAFYCISVA